MSEYTSEAIPFVRIGNRRGLTNKQVVDNPELLAFVKRFPKSFEPAEANIDAVIFIEADTETAETQANTGD